MSYSSVRDAFVASVACTLAAGELPDEPLSTVPASSSPRSAAARAPATLSRIHASLVARNRGRAAARCAPPAPLRASRPPALGRRRRCAGPATRWRDAPAARSRAPTPRPSRAARRCRCRRSRLPSVAPRPAPPARMPPWSRRSRRRRAPPTHRAESAGANGFCARASTAPSSAKTMARVLVVPASRARTGMFGSGRAPVASGTDRMMRAAGPVSVQRRLDGPTARVVFTMHLRRGARRRRVPSSLRDREERRSTRSSHLGRSPRIPSPRASRAPRSGASR